MVGLAARNIWLDFSVICSGLHSLCGELVIVVIVRDTVALQS